MATKSIINPAYWQGLEEEKEKLKKADGSKGNRKTPKTFGKFRLKKALRGTKELMTENGVYDLEKL